MNISKYIENIEQIYQEYNIHKCILICKYNDVDLVYQELIRLDYSICTVENIERFNTLESRILLISEDMLFKFDKIMECVIKDDINMVIAMGIMKTNTFIENVEHIFL